MAVYHSGQRVKKVAHRRAVDRAPRLTVCAWVPLETEGTVLGPYVGEGGGWRVAWDGYAKWLRATDYMLAPLTDPSADEWAADKIRQLQKPGYLEPTVMPEIAKLAEGSQ